jgi:hypothetical protein
MASDGIWDEIKRKQTATIASELKADPTIVGYQLRDQKFTTQLNYRITMLAQKHAAEKAGISFEFLAQLDPGPRKRDIHDDMSLIVLNLH